MASKETAEKVESATAPAAASSKRTKTGVVVSNKMQKTVVVAVENIVVHPMYQKYVKQTSKFLAHSENDDVKVGDRVVIEETRPLSKRKRWNVREVLNPAG
jgi:small subunit ribosomal protein S17